MPATSPRYPDIDREMLLNLKPVAIIQLLPDASPQQLAAAKRTWAAAAHLPAVQAGRVTTRTDWYLLQPGSQLARIAAEFADFLHPDAKPATTPATAPTPKAAP